MCLMCNHTKAPCWDVETCRPRRGNFRALVDWRNGVGLRQQHCADENYKQVSRMKKSGPDRLSSVLHRHRFGIHGFLSCDSLKSSQNSSVVILVSLHGEAAFLVTIGPRQTDI